MAYILITYYSQTGNTEKMAEIIANNLTQYKMQVDLKKITNISADELSKYDAIVVGSPTYYGTMAYQIKKLFDESVSMHGELDGKIGAAFTTSANIAGGNETTLLSILQAMLIHGFIIQGDPVGSHYGAVSIGMPDDRAKSEALRFADRLCGLIKLL